VDSRGLEKIPNFDQVFLCDPSKPHKGFHSWDDFFTRKLRDGIRPIASPDDDTIICNACESSPFRLARNVSYYDRFWIKAQPYSLQYLLDAAGDDNKELDGQNTPAEGNGKEKNIAEQFIGGTIYQVG
jgi:phosphatidylserine decarboxylase